MNFHVTNCHVKVAILTEYGRVGSSVVHFGGVYTACDLGTKISLANQVHDKMRWCRGGEGGERCLNER